MSLKTYKQKRDFKITPEPRGKTVKKSRSKPIFVVQKHHATQLHYDFRLEIDGTLKSWAVPKGPSTNPAKKRLAMETEDHPIEYASFEGVIPDGQYGAGKVIVWDKGTYENQSIIDHKKVSALEGYKKGEIKFELKGKKLKGSYVLVKTRGLQKNAWLLIKHRDEHASLKEPAIHNPESVLSHKMLEEIK